ncbi:MAG: cytochrome c [Actinomycetota bacterium]|nr:cytochrome c [Actinomycetota bacterium]
MINKWRQSIAVGLAAMALLAACGGDSGPDGDLSDAALEGRKVAAASGCTACHGDNGEGRVGPAWVGLAGSVVDLEGGSAVTADTAYLSRSITDPQAEIVAGVTVAMPTNDLSGDEVAALVAYIEELR